MVGVLKGRQSADNADDYRQEFGYLGPAIQAAVARARAQAASTPSAGGSGRPGSSSGASGNPASAAAANAGKYMFVTSRPSTPVQVTLT